MVINKTKSKYSNRQIMKANNVNNCLHVSDQGKQSRGKKINCFYLEIIFNQLLLESQRVFQSSGLIKR